VLWSGVDHRRMGQRAVPRENFFPDAVNSPPHPPLPSPFFTVNIPVEKSIKNMHNHPSHFRVWMGNYGVSMGGLLKLRIEKRQC
jgi:hypothetical protein